MTSRPARSPSLLLLALLLAAAPLAAQTRVTTPEDFFGHRIGTDYVLPNYQRLSAYWRTLDAESDRMKLVSIGTTAEGREQLMAIITSPENHARLDRYRGIAARLARAEGLDEEAARALAREGKAVVWIDGGLHATEVLGAQQLMELVYQLVGRDDAETRRILDDVIVLAAHANPDGHDLVADWYMREEDPEKRSTAGIPRLYQKYVGHDNNRDFYASVQPESENINRVLYREWYPQIVYNHHQTGPTGTVMFAPPFRDPFNYVYDPLIITSLDLVGAAMHNRFVAEAKPGVTMRRGANYSTWWNGGLRTTPYFHNMIGLLTETIGHPTPIEIPFIPNRQLPHADLPFPIEPQTWHFRQSVDYSMTANYAVLDVASRYRETLLLNIWRMGRNAIERGSRDSWTVYPKRIDRVRTAMETARKAAADADGMAVGGLMRNPPELEESLRYKAMLEAPELRDPRGYVLPADQPDFPTAAKFVDALMETGVTVHRATADFTVNGRSYPKGSFVVKTAQAFRPHVLDMFEPQDHPNDFRYEGGPPIPPYDNAGWTLAYQMGVEFDRILDGFDAPLEVVEGEPQPPAGTIGTARGQVGYLLSPRANDAFVVANRLMAAGVKVHRLREAWEHRDVRYEAGTFFIPATDAARPIVRDAAAELGLDFAAATARPGGEHFELRRPRIALWDRYGGSMPSGWTRWILERFEFPFEVVYPRRLDEGDLRDDYDVIVFVDGAIPSRDGGARSRWNRMPDEDRIPEAYHHMLGRVSVERTVPRLREFLEAGGTIVTIGGSTVLAKHLGLPVEDKLVATTADGGTRPLNREEYYVPGSILRVRVDNTRPIAHGLPERVDVMFDNSPVFALGDDAERAGVARLGWFDTDAPLRSGWAWGQHHLQGGATILEAEVGEGKLLLFGPEVLFRAQPHGTFKFVFNSLLYGPAGESRIR